MATENESPQSQAPSAISTSTLNQTPPGFLKSFSDVTKFTVFFAFAFYTLGFIIWQSYLGNFGLSSISFLQTEYVSAAFCYLVVLLGLAYPSIFILTHILMVLGKTDQGRLKKYPVSHTLWTGAFVYVLLIFTFIPVNGLEYPSLGYLNILGKLFIPCVLLGVILNKLKIPKNQQPLAWGFYNNEVMDIFFAICVLVSICSHREIDKLFILYSITVVILIKLSFLKELKAEVPNSYKVLYVFIISLALLGNIQYFGKYQFQYIPKQVGGGKPEAAYLKFSPERKELAESLNLTPAADANISSGFYGPVAILLRSENEIIFLDYQETNQTRYVTNYVSGTKTNYTSSIVTNNMGSLTTNVVMALTNNVTPYLSKYEAPKIAKEVQANVVDAIIFKNKY